MRIRNILWLLAIVAVSPLLMAPGEDECPACLNTWTGTGKAQVSSVYVVRVEKQQPYWCELLVLDGKAALDVFGRHLTNVRCKMNGESTVCTFEATADDVVELEVSGMGEGATYKVFFDYGN